MTIDPPVSRGVFHDGLCRNSERRPAPVRPDEHHLHTSLAEADPLESPFVAHVTQLCEQTETKTSSSGGEISGEGRRLCDTSAISLDADPTSTPRFTGTDVTRLIHCSEMTARAGRVMYV